MPSSWAGYIDWIEIVKHKEIETGDKIIVYGYGRESEIRLAGNFIKAGYEDVSIYPSFLDEWVTGERYPLEKLARYVNLVPASWLNKLVTGNKPDEYNNDKFVIVHAHYRNRDAYLSGHTKRFNLNHLKRLNRELDADFDLGAFEHYTSSDPQSGVVSSYLVSLKNQLVRFESTGNEFIFGKWEAVFMERSRKFDPDTIEYLAGKYGFRVLENFTDNKKWFTDSLWIKK